MADFAEPVARLIDELKHLPGIGQKTAQRLAFHLLRATPAEALALVSLLLIGSSHAPLDALRAASLQHFRTFSAAC